MGFALRLAGWGFILSEIIMGAAGQCAGSDSMSKHVPSSFQTMCFIVTVGWVMYLLGYLMGYLMGGV